MNNTETLRNQINEAIDLIGRHQPSGASCTCLRALPCPVKEKFETYLAGCLQLLEQIERAQAAITEPTIQQHAISSIT